MTKTEKSIVLRPGSATESVNHEVNEAITRQPASLIHSSNAAKGQPEWLVMRRKGNCRQYPR
jgi:hypothetical protein